jgi:hypothetical protein
MHGAGDRDNYPRFVIWQALREIKATLLRHKPLISDPKWKRRVTESGRRHRACLAFNVMQRAVLHVATHNRMGTLVLGS